MKMFDSVSHTIRICKIYLTKISKYRKKQVSEALWKNFVVEFSLIFVYLNSVIAMNEETIRQYFKNQENEDIHVEQHSLANM